MLGEFCNYHTYSLSCPSCYDLVSATDYSRAICTQVVILCNLGMILINVMYGNMHVVL